MNNGSETIHNEVNNNNLLNINKNIVVNNKAEQ